MGGKTTSSNKVPKYIEQGGMEAIDRARGVADMGYVPYIGPDVAAPGQGTLAAWANQNAAANAFGMAAPTSTGLEGLPVANNGGVQGYSSHPGYAAALQSLQTEYPGLFAYLQSMMINPQTGAAPTMARPSSTQVGGGLLGGGAKGSAGGYADGDNERSFGSDVGTTPGGGISMNDVMDAGFGGGIGAFF